MAKPDIKSEWVEKYTDSLASHLRYYKQAADKLGVDKSLMLIHDNSKSMEFMIIQRAWMRNFLGMLGDLVEE